MLSTMINFLMQILKQWKIQFSTQAFYDFLW